MMDAIRNSVTVCVWMAFFAAAAALAQEADIPPSALLLQVQVTDGSNTPLPGVEVRLENTTLGETDELGRFYLPRKPIDPGRYALTLSLLGYATKSTVITVPADDAALPVKVTVQLERAELPVQPQVGKQRPNFKVYQIFYATDRKSTASSDPEEYYGSERIESGQVELGTCDVSIPLSHMTGALESPALIRMEFRFDPDKHVQLYKPQPLASDKFYQKLQARVTASKKKEIFVFIHGYNTRFGEAARRTAQLDADLGFDGAAVLFSWPSKGTYSGYFSDQKTVEWTAPHFRAFLEDLAAKSGAAEVHLIAHSMGNRVMTAALQAMANEDSSESRPHFQQIVLAAPDIRVNMIRSLAQAMVPLGQKVTLYASANDDALILARVIDGFARAGERVRDVVQAMAGAEQRQLSGIDAVDASAVRTDFVGHGYFAASPSLIADLRKLLLGQSPELRKLDRVNLAPFHYWMIPNATASVK
jgi:esterase/lipase superfamily enzyme